MAEPIFVSRELLDTVKQEVYHFGLKVRFWSDFGHFQASNFHQILWEIWSVSRCQKCNKFMNKSAVYEGGGRVQLSGRTTRRFLAIFSHLRQIKSAQFSFPQPPPTGLTCLWPPPAHQTREQLKSFLFTSIINTVCSVKRICFCSFSN